MDKKSYEFTLYIFWWHDVKNNFVFYLSDYSGIFLELLSWLKTYKAVLRLLYFFDLNVVAAGQVLIVKVLHQAGFS